MPSGPSFWDKTGGKSILVGGSSIYGGYALYRNHKENMYQRNMLRFERGKGLKEGWINPEQYVLHAREHGLSVDEMKQELVGWGGESKGTNYADPEAFSLTEKWHESSNPIRRALGREDRSCTLNVHKSNKGGGSEHGHLSMAPTEELSVLTTEQKGEGKGTKRLGRRGGSNQLIEVQEVAEQLNNGIEIATHRHNYSPDSVYQVAEAVPDSVYQVAEAVPGRPILSSYTCTGPQEIGPVPFYLFSLVFVITSTYLATYVQKRFLKPAMSKNSILRDLFGEEQESAPKATAQLLLDIFTSYRNKTISRAQAVYILVKCCNLSEDEADKLLDD